MRPMATSLAILCAVAGVRLATTTTATVRKNASSSTRRRWDDDRDESFEVVGDPHNNQSDLARVEASDQATRDAKMTSPPSRRPTSSATCPQPSVPYRAFSACVLADGRCVADEAECARLGGTFDEGGCGGGKLYMSEAQKLAVGSRPVRCACCAHLPTMAPTAGPTESRAPTRPYPRGACAVERVPTWALKTCLKDSRGFCLSSEAECDDLGGTFDATGCDAEARCGCCANVPTRPPVGEGHVVTTASASPSVAPTTTTAFGNAVWPPRAWIKGGGGGGVVLENRPAAPQPTAAATQREEREERQAGAATPHSTYFQLASLSLLLALASALFPQPSNPIARALLAPFALIALFLKTSCLFFASFCFTFGDGIAEPRPPAPIGMKPMPVRELQMSERRLRTGEPPAGGPSAAASAESLLADAELELVDDLDPDNDDDDDDDGADGGGSMDNGKNPFKKRT